ncbi:MAG: mscL [Parcubacteria group bacterium]|nr:mscL [Parcubacteria group bacterium]
MKGFIHFLRTQGVAGLAIGFIIGSAAQDFVKSLSTNILTPIVGRATGSIGDLQNASSTAFGISFGWGPFLSSLINLILIAFVVYIFFKGFHLERLDEKKEE